jgi:hypothetical protein
MRCCFALPNATENGVSAPRESDGPVPGQANRCNIAHVKQLAVTLDAVLLPSRGSARGSAWECKNLAIVGVTADNTISCEEFGTLGVCTPAVAQNHPTGA